MGAVKMAHTHYPTKVLQKWFQEETAARNRNRDIPRGNWHVLKTTFRNRLDERQMGLDADYDVLAVCWADKKAKCIITNWGTTVRCASDSIRRRTATVVDETSGLFQTVNKDKTVMQPNVIQEFFKYFGAIDINDHLRPGILAIERQWMTKKWWVRIFQTMLGIIIVDSYLAYRLEYLERNENNPDQCLDFISFVNILCKELITYQEIRVLRNAGPRNDAIDVIISLFHIF